MHSMRKLLSRPNHEGVMTHYVTIRAEAESPDALVVLLTAETQGVGSVLGVSVDTEIVEARERISKLREKFGKILRSACDLFGSISPSELVGRIEDAQRSLAEQNCELNDLRSRVARQAETIRELCAGRNAKVAKMEVDIADLARERDEARAALTEARTRFESNAESALIEARRAAIAEAYMTLDRLASGLPQGHESREAAQWAMDHVYRLIDKPSAEAPASDPSDQVDFEDFNGAMRKRASDLREAEPAALWFRRKRFVPEPKRLSHESAKLLFEEGNSCSEPVSAAIREALSILRPELLRG